MNTYTDLLKYKMLMKGLNETAQEEVLELAKSDDVLSDVSDMWDKPATQTGLSVMWMVVKDLADEYKAVFAS